MCLLALMLAVVEMAVGAGGFSTLLVTGMLVYMQSAMNPHMRSTLVSIDNWVRDSLPDGMQGAWGGLSSFVGSFDPVEQARKQHEAQQQQAAGGQEATGGGGITGMLSQCVAF